MRDDSRQRVQSVFEDEMRELLGVDQGDPIRSLHTDQAIHILDMIFDTPVFRATDLHKRPGIQQQRAAIYIRVLKEAVVIIEIRPASGRKSALLSFEDLW